MAGAVAFAATVAGAVFSGGTLLSSVAGVALSVGLSWAASELAPEPNLPSFSQSGRSLSFRSEAAVRPIRFGTSQVGGPITFARVTDGSVTPFFGGGEGRVLHIIIPLAGHPVDAIPRVWFGETELEIEPNGNVAGPFAGNMVVKRHTGAHDQAADPDLLAAFPDLDANFRGRNVPYIYAALRRNQEVYPQGLLNFAAEVRGALLFDPRDPAQVIGDPLTYVHSDNAELAIIHYLRGCPMLDAAGALIRPYGVALPDDRFGDWADVAAEASICDEAVPLAAGGTEKRYTLNGSVSTESAPRNELPRLMSAMAGRLVHQPKRWSVRAGAARAPVADWDRTVLRGDGLTHQPSRSLAGLFTEVQGRYVDGDTYKEGTYPVIKAPQFETAIYGAVRKPLDFPYTNSASRCQRLAKIALMQAHKQTSLKLRVAYRNVIYMSSDWVSWTDPLHDRTALPMEIANSALATFPSDDGGDGVAYGIEVELQETGADVYDWDPVEEEGVIHQGASGFGPDALNVPAPASLSAAVLDFTTAAVVELTAGLSASDLDYSYRFSRKLEGDQTFTESATQKSPVRIERDVPPGTHTFRVQAVNRLGRVSAPTDTVLQVGPPALVDRVAGLELAGQGGNKNFTGPDAAFAWRRGSVEAPGLEDPDGADAFEGDAHFAGYALRFFAGAYTGVEPLPQVLRSADVFDEQVTYALDHNRQDALRLGLSAPARTFTIEVIQRGRWGQEALYSEPAYLTVSNPAPPAVTSLSARRGARTSWLKFTTQADGDLAGVVARSSTDPAFDAAAGEGRLDYEGDLTNEVQFDVSPGETRYARVAVFDQFGKSGLNWSPAIEISAKALTAADFSQEVQDGLAAAESVGSEYFVKVDAEGKIAGIALIGGETVDAAFLVDSFSIAQPGEVPVPVFVVDGGTGEVRLNALIAASITTDEFLATYAEVTEFVGGVVRSDDGQMISHYDDKYWEIA